MKHLAWLLLVAAGCSAHQAGPRGASPTPASSRTTPAGVDTASARALDLTGEERAALRIERVEIEIEPSTLREGETAALRWFAYDAAGEPVRDAAGQLYVEGRAVEITADEGAVIGRRPGVALVAVVFEIPASDAGPARSVRQEAAVEVLPAPVSGIELELPGGALYAGIRYVARARAVSDFGPRRDAVIEWSSSDEDVIGVRPKGFLMPVAPGEARIRVEAEGVVSEAEVTVVRNPVRGLTIDPLEASFRTGDVLHLSATALDVEGRALPDAPVEWSVATIGETGQVAATMDEDGTFVADEPGLYRITATVGAFSRVSEIEVEPRFLRAPLSGDGHRFVPPRGSTTGLRVFEGTDGRDYAYTGTVAATMYAWDVTDPTNAAITDSVDVGPGQGVVRINGDATLAVVTIEDGPNRAGGFTILDVSDAAHPAVFTHVSEGFPEGVSDVWIEDDLVYAVPRDANDLRIVDISDPGSPRNAGDWELVDPAGNLFGVTVQDGLAYLSSGYDGLVVLDVGAGIRGGTPTRPRFVSQYRPDTKYGDGTGSARQAVRYRNYVFLGEEIVACSGCGNGPRGHVRVIDVTDIENPVEVAIYGVPEARVYRPRAEEERLYVAGDRSGLRVVDISGELRGDLYRQGRELGHVPMDAGGFGRDPAFAGGPQPYKGHVFLSAPGSGLWIVDFDELRPSPLR